MEQDESVVEVYLTELTRVLAAIPREPLLDLISVFRQAHLDRKRIFVFGNGGSAAASSHLAADLGKNVVLPGILPLRIISLTDNLATLTAYANDEGYEQVFAQPLRTLAEKGDLAVAISGSGNSPNVIHAVRVARELGLITIGLTGFDGGRLKDEVVYSLIVPSNCMEQIEDVHLIINHILKMALGGEMTGFV